MLNGKATTMVIHEKMCLKTSKLRSNRTFFSFSVIYIYIYIYIITCFLSEILTCFFLSEWLGQVDISKGDDLLSRPFFQPASATLSRSFSDVFGLILHFACTEFQNMDFNTTFLQSNVESPQNLLNIVIPNLGAPESPPNGEQNAIPIENQRLRLISPNFIAHLVYSFLHAVYPTRDAVLENLLRSHVQV
jgi:hypothetical protein